MGKKAKGPSPQAEPSGPRSLTDVLMGPERIKAINQMFNEPLGYGPEYVSQVSRPDINYREQQFRNYELPALQESLGARGISRSSLGADLERRAQAEEQTNLANIIGQAMREQAQAKYSERQVGFQGMQQANQEEMQGRYAYDQQVQQARNYNAQIATNAQAQQQARNQQLLGLGVAGASTLANMFVPGSGFAVSSLAKPIMNQIYPSYGGYPGVGGLVGSQGSQGNALNQLSRSSNYGSAY